MGVAFPPDVPPADAGLTLALSERSIFRELILRRVKSIAGELIKFPQITRLPPKPRLLRR